MKTYAEMSSFERFVLWFETDERLALYSDLTSYYMLCALFGVLEGLKTLYVWGWLR